MQNFESLVKLARGATDKTVAIATAPAPNAQAGSKLPQFINLDIVTTDGTVSISGPDGVWEIDIRNFAEQPRLSSDPDGHPQTTPRVRPVGSTALKPCADECHGRVSFGHLRSLAFWPTASSRRVEC
jgi:hypothetical protein